VDTHLINHASHRLVAMANHIFLTVLALHMLLMVLTIPASHIPLTIVAFSILTNFVLSYV
jgi:hypothetical protein